MGIFYRRYLDSAKLKGFDSYRYACVDTSPIAVYISHPFWNWFVQFYPLWLAPNVLTFVGFAFVMGCYFLVSYLDPFLDANSVSSLEDQWLPNWIWLLCSVCTFLGHLLDGTDGKQARRTGASGPTGELFDHGLDSWSTVPFTLTIFSIFGRGEFSVSPVRLLGILISVQMVFIATHWEKYNTGILYLSWGYDASQYGLVIFYLLTYFIGHRWFQFYVNNYFFVICVLSLIVSIYNIMHCYFTSKSGKQSSLYEALLPLLPPILLFTTSLYWALYSPTSIIDKAPRIFFWSMGVVFSNIAVHLIINQMSNTRVEPFNGLLFLYVLIAVSAVQGYFGEYELLILQYLALLLTAGHIHYGICVVQQLCSHFKIYAFSLDYLKHKRRE
uniref:Ethanolaminephosphotransferase 1 n=1 Tax=Acrobeloides nanus TaxID=290746 RepID=A0A914C198_9BILA